MRYSQYGEIYRRLNEAIASNNTSAMAAVIDTETFLAMLPGIEVPLDFAQFVVELDRQRMMFSDFGRNVTIKEMIVDDNRLGAFYTMTVTHDGPLMTRDGREILPATNKKITVKSMDSLTFNNAGKIVHVVVVSDRMNTLSQLI
ncbi:MAG TPA: ester cyclase [Candidatus Saccharimonadales bacterium]|nr:ester cyclase [Candidatus Saccharimonadales bacterium]